MLIRNSNTNDRVMLVAEIGNNHEGDFCVAQKLIDKAVDAGVDAVKFQIFRTEEYTSATDKVRFGRLKGFELTPKQFSQLADQAHDSGVAFIASAFDLYSAELASEICDAIKIASGDNTFYPLLEKVAACGRPVILSTGLVGLRELRRSYEIFAEALGKNSLAILHCVTSYPVKPEEANIAVIKTLKEEFDSEIGYSDHTIGIDACLAAVACGGRIIEKHFTLDHNYSDFRDHRLSANPVELGNLVKQARLFETLLGSGVKNISSGEVEIEPSVRRSIVSRVSLPAGHVLAKDDLTWVRPAGGLPPGRESELIGNPLCHAIKAGHQLGLEDIGRSA